MSKEIPWWSPDDKPVKVRIVTRLKGRRLKIFGSLLFVFVLLTIAFVVPQEKPTLLSNGAIRNTPSLNALIASCDGIMDWPVQNNVGWLPKDSAHVYNRYPPTSGTFEKVPARSGFYSYESKDVPTLPQTVGNLWRGEIVIWYSERLSQENRQVLKSIVENNQTGLRYIVAPWPESLSRIWGNNIRALMLTGWGVSQECEDPSSAVFEEFAKAVKEKNAPGKGVPYNVPGPRGTIVKKDQ